MRLTTPDLASAWARDATARAAVNTVLKGESLQVETLAVLRATAHALDDVGSVLESVGNGVARWALT